MPFYMFQGRYSPASMKAMVGHPQDRETAARAVVKAVGGKLHEFYFCFGEEDMVAIIEAPDDTAMASCTLAIAASGALAGGKTTKLLTAKEAKAAMTGAKKASASYKPPKA